MKNKDAKLEAVFYGPGMKRLGYISEVEDRKEKHQCEYSIERPLVTHCCPTDDLYQWCAGKMGHNGDRFDELEPHCTHWAHGPEVEQRRVAGIDDVGYTLELFEKEFDEAFQEANCKLHEFFTCSPEDIKERLHGILDDSELARLHDLLETLRGVPEFMELVDFLGGGTGLLQYVGR